MADFSLRAIEVHSAYAWDFRWIMKVLTFAHAQGLNALVLHRNDVADQVVYPGVQFGARPGTCKNIFERYSQTYRNLYKYTPTRRSGPLLRRGYLRRIVEEAMRLGISVYLENKELFFPDVLLELNPQLVKNGHGCPSEPFWFDFIRMKYEELFEDVPGIAGIITSAGTGESRISITSNRCTCDLCRKMTPKEWYGKLVGVMHGVLSARGKKLVVRDFVFDKKSHDELAAGFAALPADIVVAIKNTPHDYYPTFPENPLISKLGGRGKWIEFDAMAQYFGWGIGPSTMLEDFRRRMAHAKEQGASGVIFRTDWESLDGHTAFDTLNILNLYAGSAFASDLSTADTEIYRRWLEDASAFSPKAASGERTEAARRIGDIFNRNWDVVKQALYVQDCVFNDCSTFPVGVAQALWLSEEKNSLKDWLPEKSGALLAAAENTVRILDEKDSALKLVRELRRRVESESFPGLDPEFHAELKEKYRIFELYVRGFRALVRLFALVRFGSLALSSNPESVLQLGGQPFEQLLRQAFDEIDTVIDDYEKFYSASSEAAAVYQLLDADRLRCFRDDAAVWYRVNGGEGKKS